MIFIERLLLIVFAVIVKLVCTNIIYAKYHEHAHPLGNCEVFVTDDIGRIFQEKLEKINVSEGDSYSVTFNRKIDNVDAYFDIASFNITQSVSKGSPYEQSVNNKTTPIAYQFILNRTKDDSEIFNVTKVVPVHKVDGQSMRPLYTSENSQFPLYNYSTQLLLHGTNEKLVSFHLVHRITLHASYARCNGGNLDAEGKHLHITLRFLNPIHFATPQKMVGDSADVEMPPEAHLKRYHSRNHTDSDDSEFEPPLDSLEIARVDLESDE